MSERVIGYVIHCWTGPEILGVEERGEGEEGVFYGNFYISKINFNF